MATVNRLLVADGKNLEPGKSAHWRWNPTTEKKSAVFALSIWPRISFQNNPIIDKELATAEIRNVRYKAKEPIANVQMGEFEVHYDVHNLSEYPIDYRVYMAIVVD